MRLHEKAPPELRDPRRVAVGRASIRRRWDADAIAHGKAPGRRTARLDDLDPISRQIVLAIIEAAENAKKAAPAIVTPEAAQEARRDRDEHPAAA